MWNISRPSGLTVIELIVALGLAAVVGLFTFQGYVYGTRQWESQHGRLQVQQSLRTAVDILVREARLGGACLPDAGPLVAFAGTDQQVGGRDADVLVVHANATCATATLNVNQANPAAPMTVDVTDGFSPGQQAYVLHADTTTGEFFVIGSVVGTLPRTITPNVPLTRAYPQNSTIFGVEEKAFGVDTTAPTPAFTIDPTYVGGAPPVPIIRGIESLNVRFVVNRLYADAPAACVGNTADGWCIVNPPPTGSSDWRIVREVEVTLTARSLQPISGGDVDGFLRMPASVRIKPRNLISP